MEFIDLERDVIGDGENGFARGNCFSIVSNTSSRLIDTQIFICVVVLLGKH